MKYVDVMSSERKFGIHENDASSRQMTGAPVYAKPASSAPPGRRTPKVTTTVIQISPVIGGTLSRLIANDVRPYMAPPKPAMPADSANNATWARAGEMPEVSAATDDERTANMARPDGDRCRLWMSKVITPKTMSSPHTRVDDLEKSKVLIPNRFRVGKRNAYPNDPFPTSSLAKTMKYITHDERERRERERERSHASDRVRDQRAEGGGDERAEQSMRRRS